MDGVAHPPPRAPLDTRRQTLAFATLLALLTITGLLAMALQLWSDHTSHTELDRETRELALTLRTQGAAERMAAALRAYVLSRDESYRQQYESARDEVQLGLARLSAPPHDPLVRRHAAALAVVFARYQHDCNRLAQAIAAARSDAVVADSMPLWRSRILPAYEDLEDRWDMLVAQQQATVTRVRARLEDVRQAAARSGWAFLMLLLASAAFAVWSYRESLRSSRDSYHAVLDALEDLRRSEDNLRLTLEGVTDYAIIQLDRSGRIASWNASASRIRGYETEDVLGCPMEIFFTPEDREAGLPQRLLSAAAASGSHTEDCWQQCADGRRFRASLTISALHADDGSVQGFVQVCHDISARFELEERLREALAQNEFVQHAARIGVWHWDPETNAVWWSDSLKAQLGYAPQELQAGLATLKRLLHPDDRERILALLQEARERPRPYYEQTMRLQRRDGSWQWTLSRGTWYETPHAPGVRVLLGVNLDLSALHEAHERVAAEREAALVTLHSIGEGLIVTDPQGCIEQMNQSACAMTGWSEAEARGRPASEVFRLVHEHNGEPLPDPVGACLRADAQAPGLAQLSRLLARDGRSIPIEESVAAIDIHGQRRGAVLVFRDVSETRRIVRDISWEANHDALTGLLNRREFDRRLQRAVAESDAGTHHALLYFDLDRFKIVNDSCGHAAGDELLRQLARLVESRLRERDSLARLGGDEFAVLLDHCSPAHARSVAENILAALRDWRFVCNGRAFQVGASIGLVPFQSGRHSADELMRQADQAAYAAKQGGRDRVVLQEPGAGQFALRQQDGDVVGRLGAALREDRFELHAQPIVPVAAARDSSERCEILVRLRGADGSLMPPASFLPAAERHELMPQLDRAVIDKTLRLLARAPDRLAQLSLCTFNLSARTLQDEAYADHVGHLLRETGVPADKFCFEITEADASADLPRVRRFIERLRALGCRIALAHFGHGLGSFSALKQLPVDYIKIDGSFIETLSDSRIELSLVRAINDISHEMGRQTIAEFVPDVATLDVLRRLGIDFAQGYGLGRPERLEALA